MVKSVGLSTQILPAENLKRAVLVDKETGESWSRMLAEFKDSSIYQTWAYGAVRWGESAISHLTIRAGAQPVAAAQVRIVRFRFVPYGIAYLRWGPLCRTGEDAEHSFNLRHALEALKQEYWGKRRLLLQVVPHLFCGTPEGEALLRGFEEAGFTPLTPGNSYRTVRVDLGANVEHLRKSLDQKWRNQLNRAEKNGLEVVASYDSSAYDEFLVIYRKMWDRKRFETSVDVEQFGKIQESLPEGSRMRIFLARHAGQTIAAVVCSAMGESGIYLLGATDEKGRELKAAYVLQWQTMLWLKENGIRWYDLGGIDRHANPGGYHFKSGMGGGEQTTLPAHQYCGNFLLARLGYWAFRLRGMKNTAAA